MEKDPAPQFNVACLFLKITAIAVQHCLGVRGADMRRGGQKGIKVTKLGVRKGNVSTILSLIVRSAIVEMA